MREEKDTPRSTMDIKTGIGDLPDRLYVNGRSWDIRTDFRAVLDILAAFEDSELTDQDKVYIMLYIMYPGLDRMHRNDHEEAARQACRFIDCGRETEDSRKPGPRQMSWSQDAAIIFPSVNKIAGGEVRSEEYMHWWTFMGYFMEIGEGTFATVLSIRDKKRKHKKLEKYEQEFYTANRAMCDLSIPESAEENEEKDRIKNLLG